MASTGCNIEATLHKVQEVIIIIIPYSMCVALYHDMTLTVGQMGQDLEQRSQLHRCSFSPGVRKEEDSSGSTSRNRDAHRQIHSSAQQVKYLRLSHPFCLHV